MFKEKLEKVKRFEREIIFFKIELIGMISYKEHYNVELMEKPK